MCAVDANPYSPVSRTADGAVHVELASEHPGVADPEYRARRNAIAALAHDRVIGDAIPHVDYTEQEHDVWRIVARELDSKHREYAARSFRAASERLDLPRDHIPQLAEV